MRKNEALEWSLQLLECQPDSADGSFEENRNLLIRVVDQLIQSDFNKLINILYRIDVDEQKLKDALFENPSPPPETIADMMIERQLQKVRFREQFKNKDKEQ